MHSNRMRTARTLTVLLFLCFCGGVTRSEQGTQVTGGVTYPMMHVTPQLPKIEQTNACENITLARYKTLQFVMPVGSGTQ